MGEILSEIRAALRESISSASSRVGQGTGDINSIVEPIVSETMQNISRILSAHMARVLDVESARVSSSDTRRSTAVPFPPSSTGVGRGPDGTAAEQEPGRNNREGDQRNTRVSSQQQQQSNENKSQDADKRKNADSGPSTSSQPGAKSNPVGLGGGLKRRKTNEKLPPRGKEDSSARPNAPKPSRANEQQPSAGRRQPSRSGSSGMQGMFAQVLQSPAFQQSAEQLMGGGSGGGAAGGGLNLNSLLSSAGPLISQMMGGPPSQAQQGPVDVDALLQRDISSDEDRRALREVFEGLHSQDQGSLGSNAEHSSEGTSQGRSFSDGYLATFPPKPNGNFLDNILGGKDDDKK